MRQRARKAVFTSLRVLLCAVFFVLAVRGVAIHDRVTLMTDAGGGEAGTVTVRLVAEEGDSITVMDAGGVTRTVSRDRVAVDDNGEPRIDRGLATAMRQSDPWILALAFSVFAPITLIQSMRFQLMLRAQEIELTYWESMKLCYGGNFLNFVFPIGSTGGDVFKAYYTSLHTTRKTEAVTTILLDRIVGLAGLLILVIVMSFSGSDDPLLRQLGFAALAMFGVGVIGAWIVISPRVTNLAFGKLLSKLPGAAHIERMHAATERLIRHKPLLLLSLLASIALQFIAVGCGVICAYALGMDFSGHRIGEYFAYLGGGHMVAAIPISILGLGTMEFAYKQFFLGTHGTLAQLLCLALWVRLLQLFWSLPGAAVTLLGAHRPRRVESAEPLSATA